MRADGYACQAALPLPVGELSGLIDVLARPHRASPDALGGRGVVWRHHLPSVGDVVVKEYRRGGLWRFVTRRRYLCVGRTRPEREFANLIAARAAGLNVPEPVICLSRGWPFYRGWLVTRLIPGESLIEVAAAGGERLAPLMDELARQVRLLIETRIAHVDLHPGNVLVDTGGRLHLLDFDKARRFDGSPGELRDYYLFRWRRAVEKYSLPRALSTSLAEALLGPGAGAGAARPPRSLPDRAAILVVLMGSLGDVVRALPLVSILAGRRPRGQLTWIVDERWQEIVGLHPGIDRVIVFPKARTLRTVARLLGALRAERYDVVLDLQRHLRSGICSRLSRARRRIGFHPTNAKEFNHLFNNEYIESCPSRFSKLRHYLKFAEHLHLPVPDRLDFGLEALGTRHALPATVAAIPGPFVAVVMGSSWPSKDWPAGRYAELLSLLLRRTNGHAVLLGDESQQAIAASVGAAAGNPRVVNLVGRTSLLDLTAILQAARAAVGPDTGPGHVAAAVMTPYVGLFGPTDPKRVVPYGCDRLAVRSQVDCPPCLERECTREEGGCMAAISAEMVWEKLAPLLP
jgi:lipopolysaccharide heptosyltransferase II